MVVERLWMVGGGMLALLALVYLWRMLQSQRMGRLTPAQGPSRLAQLLETHKPTLLYFTAEWCTQCRLSQAPILAQLAELSPVTIHKVDAVEEEELARFYGVMTVPTIVVLDRERRPVAINHGLSPLRTLQEQVALVATG